MDDRRPNFEMLKISNKNQEVIKYYPTNDIIMVIKSKDMQNFWTIFFETHLQSCLDYPLNVDLACNLGFRVE